jgi:hypothetical protein
MLHRATGTASWTASLLRRFLSRGADHGEWSFFCPCLTQGGVEPWLVTSLNIPAKRLLHRRYQRTRRVPKPQLQPAQLCVPTVTSAMHGSRRARGRIHVATQRAQRHLLPQVWLSLPLPAPWLFLPLRVPCCPVYCAASDGSFLIYIGFNDYLVLSAVHRANSPSACRA